LVQYTSISGAYLCNRADESITEEDNKAYDRGDLSMLVCILQRSHIFLYGWQDKTIEWFDRLSKKLGAKSKSQRLPENSWYGSKVFLTLTSPLCLCTNNILLVFFSLVDAIEFGFWFIVVVGNSYLLLLQILKIIKTRNNLILNI